MVLRLGAAFEIPQESLDLLREVDVQTSDLLGSKAVRERRVLTHEDETPGSGRRLILARHGAQEGRYVYVPVEHRGRTMGLISLTFEGRRPFREDELSLFAAVAQVLGQAMENARLLATETQAQEAARQELEHSDILVRAAAALASSIDLESVLQTLGDLTLRSLHVSRLIVLGFDEPTGQLRTLLARETCRSLRTQCCRWSGSRSRCGARSGSGPQCLRTTTTESPAAVGDTAGESRVRRALWVPVIWQDELLGLVGVDAPGERHDFTPREVELVEAICDQAAAAIANARAYEAQRTIATTLQASFRHRLPAALRGLDVGLIEVPASAPALVGGDFWDAFELPDERVLFLIGDVAGKGVARGRHDRDRAELRQSASSIDQSPPFILRKTSELLLAEHTRQDHYVTALDSCRRSAVRPGGVGSAGHPGPIHLRGESGWVEEPSYGPPLGTFLGEYGIAELQLDPGDYLILYTDGITEARRGGDMFGESRSDRGRTRVVGDGTTDTGRGAASGGHLLRVDSDGRSRGARDPADPGAVSPERPAVTAARRRASGRHEDRTAHAAVRGCSRCSGPWPSQRRSWSCGSATRVALGTIPGAAGREAQRRQARQRGRAQARHAPGPASRRRSP